MQHHGVVAGLYASDLGDHLTADAAIGATELQVRDVADFDDENGGFLVLGGAVLAYTGADDDTSTIQLEAPLTTAAANFDRVDVWDAENGAKSTIYKAIISDFDGYTGGAPVEAVVAQEQLPQLTEAMRAGKGESVTLTREDDGTLKLSGIDGRANALASMQYLQGGMTTRTSEDEAGVEIHGVDSGTAGVYVYDANGDVSMQLSDDAAGGIFQFWTRDASELGPGWVNPGLHTGNGVVPTPALELASPRTSVGRSHIDLFPDQVYVDTGLFVDAAATVEGHIVSNTGNVSSSSGTVTAGTKLITLAPDSTTNPANAHISGTGDIELVTSLSKDKLDQREFDAGQAGRLLALTAKTWLDRATVERNDGDTTGIRRTPGLVAEDVERHVPELALYDADGDLQGVAYDRVAALLLPIIQKQQKDIAGLIARVEALESAQTPKGS